MMMRRTAFSLVELSIVLVILGLLVGGILAGQSLIRAAAMRSVLADTQGITTALYSFRDKYFQKPGDMTNATSFWGVLAGTGSDATCQNTPATGLPTCNGGGDNQINTSVVNADERIRAWQHLANAGLLAGKYTGATTGAPGTFVHTPGVNAPAAKMDTSYFRFVNIEGTVVAHGWLFDGTYSGAYMEFRNLALTGFLTPTEQWNMDTKMDDGIPGKGNFIGPASTSASYAGCTTTDDMATAVYALSNSAKVCAFNLKAYP